MPVNTNREPGVRLGEFLTERKYMDEYTELTERYMRKSGLRALTIWDDANDDLRDSYERNCRYIYGATVQNFGAGNVVGGVTNNRLWFAKHETHYEGVYNTVLTDMTRKIRAWENSGNNGNAPHFLSYQVKIWEFHTPQLVRLHDDIKTRFEGSVEIEFVRADHFFALYNEANGMPFNLCMNEKTVITNSGNQSVEFDFGDVYAITRIDVNNPSHNFKLELSEDGVNWTAAGEYKITAGKSFVDADLINSVTARYAKVIFAGSEFFAGDIEIYGYVKK
jgi:hypothetical protein